MIQSRTNRLYIENFKPESHYEHTLNESQTHYLKSVLRFKKGDSISIFNEMYGEWLAVYDGNKKIILGEKLKESTLQQPKALAFAPLIKSDLNRFIIEKGTELGVTDFYPLKTQHGQMHKLNHEKMNAWAIEAVEQSERFNVPQIHETKNLSDLLNNTNSWSFYAAFERDNNAVPYSTIQIHHPSCVIIGPEGGWSLNERNTLSSSDHVKLISLGNNILRAETACIVMLSKSL
jgi:16S rRNA (uracil1498-N3)-methyltransferase